MSVEYRLTDFLPTTKKELELRGWSEVDVVLFSGDAYVDHPSFGAAVIGRLLEDQGLKVALVPQPDWRGDHRDFTKMGRPRLFFAVTAGNMDSMVNHYTAGKRLRSDDAYTADGKAGARPDYATSVYCTILKQLYPDVPIVIGGIEASLRRLTHYDYWSDSLMPSILVGSKADLLVYGMGEKPLLALCQRLLAGEAFSSIHDIQQTVFLLPATYQTLTLSFPVTNLDPDSPTPTHQLNSSNPNLDSHLAVATEFSGSRILRLHSHEECLMSKRKQAENFRHIEEESNKLNANTLIQQVGTMELVVNPPFPPLTTAELDRSYEYPYTRLPHPKYKGKTIPAYEMIKFSVNIHRGCFGGCAFCTISAHQGKFVMNRSKESVLREVRLLTDRPDFKGYLTDLGGPSANMYRMEGRDLSICATCKKPSCIHHRICPNLNTDHGPLLDLYHSVDALPGIKKSFIGSGIRYDLLTSTSKDSRVDKNNREYFREVVFNHVSGRLKVAPEHTSNAVLDLMRKPNFEQFKAFNTLFEKLEDDRQNQLGSNRGATSGSNRGATTGNNLVKVSGTGRQQLIPYFISSHPGCTEPDMANLASEARKLHFKLEQVQDFTPTPMTLATEIYYTGLHPYTLKPVFTARTKAEKEKQRSYFFWHQT